MRSCKYAILRALKIPSRLKVSPQQNEPDQATKGPKRDRQSFRCRHPAAIGSAS
jgi:hypothetical protein